MVQVEVAGTKVGRAGPLAAATIFLVAYVLVAPLSGAFADRAMPLPSDAAEEIASYIAANPIAAFVGSGLQLVSVLGLLMFARWICARSWDAVAARLAVMAMVVSSLLTATAVAVVGEVGDETVALLRQGGFYFGGVAHVAALGCFVVLTAQQLHRRGLLGRGIRAFGYVAGTLAVLSLLSVAIYYANALLPVGRVLCMAWAVTVGVSLWRRQR